jgi:hypothetical protein
VSSWQIFGSAGTILGAVVAWFGLDFLPVEARIVVSIVAALLLLVAVACEFPRFTRHMWDAKRRKLAIALGLAIALLGVTFSYITAIWHSVVLQRACTASEPGWQCFEIRLPWHAEQVDVRAAIDSRSGPPASWSGSFWSGPSGASATRRKNEDYELTVSLTGSGARVRYGVAYRHSGPTDDVDVAAPPIRLIEPSRFTWFFMVEGVALWILGALVLYYSPLWVPWLQPDSKGPPSSDIQVS